MACPCVWYEPGLCVRESCPCEKCHPKPTKPSRDYSQMPRAEAERHFGNRLLKLKEDIRSLPPAEKLLLAAGFVNEGLHTMAASTAELAAVELRELARTSGR